MFILSHCKWTTAYVNYQSFSRMTFSGYERIDEVHPRQAIGNTGHRKHRPPSKNTQRAPIISRALIG